MYNKFQVYYQPKLNSREDIKSLTISFYDFDEDGNYKQKIVLEKGNGKYKIKRIHRDGDLFWKRVEALQMSNFTAEAVSMVEEYFYIQCGDIVIEANDKASIQKILDLVEFDKVISYDISAYVPAR